MTSLPHPFFRELLAKNSVFEGLVCWTGGMVAIGDERESRMASVQLVSGNFFDVLGVEPVLGRTLKPQDDRTPSSHPVLVLSHDVFNERSGTVIAVALSSQPQRAGFPLTHELQSARLPKRSWVKISQIRTLAAERIGAKLGRASPEELAHVIEGLNEIIN